MVLMCVSCRVALHVARILAILVVGFEHVLPNPFVETIGRSSKRI